MAGHHPDTMQCRRVQCGVHAGSKLGSVVPRPASTGHMVALTSFTYSPEDADGLCAGGTGRAGRNNILNKAADGSDSGRSGGF